MSTSAIKNRLCGDTATYSALLQPVAARLVSISPDPAMQKLFRTMPHMVITTLPMAICDRLVKDLGGQASDDLLQALGTLCFHISTHDDLVDEPPPGRTHKAALLYAGNVSLLEGCELLTRAVSTRQAAAIWHEITRNHLLQQRCVTALWEAAPQNFAEYRAGIEHVGVLTGIAARAALAVLQRDDLWPRLQTICNNYGVALQLLDDVAEIGEDRVSGYHSFPLLEGPPFAESFRQLKRHLDAAEQGSDPAWHNFNNLFGRTRAVAQKMQASL